MDQLLGSRPVEVADAFRREMPADMPLFFRISATDWFDGGWDPPQSIELAKVLREHGVDLIDTSSGLVPHAVIPVGRNYQVPFAAAIRAEAKIMTGTVGTITDPQQADEIITSGSADIVLLAREMLREPYWAIKVQQALEQEPSWPLQYGYAVKRRATLRQHSSSRRFFSTNRRPVCWEHFVPAVSRNS